MSFIMHQRFEKSIPKNRTIYIPSIFSTSQNSQQTDNFNSSGFQITCTNPSQKRVINLKNRNLSNQFFLFIQVVVFSTIDSKRNTKINRVVHHLCPEEQESLFWWLEQTRAFILLFFKNPNDDKVCRFLITNPDKPLVLSTVLYLERDKLYFKSFENGILKSIDLSIVFTRITRLHTFVDSLRKQVSNWSTVR